jgi:hypothetical protein
MAWSRAAARDKGAEDIQRPWRSRCSGLSLRGCVLANKVVIPRDHVGLAVFFQAEDALRRRCAMVASRLELSASALVLLEVVCHADAALDDLALLAESQGLVLDTFPTHLRVWAAGAIQWATDLWPSSATRGYRALLVEMRRHVPMATSLRRASLESGDRRMADWCAIWTEQREGLADRLAVSLAQDQVIEYDAGAHAG